MFRVDVEKLSRQNSNACKTQIARYPNPFYDADFQPDDFESDEFRMFSFKIKKCALNRPHDWIICPYAHHGERARRRDPRKVPYMPVSCPDYRASCGNCPRGETCEFAHGVFEYWLHPVKYRTRACNVGRQCTRPICFFAHSTEELRTAAMVHLPKWVRLGLLRARFKAQQTSGSLPTSAASGARELGVIERPVRMSNTPTRAPSVLWDFYSSSPSSVTAQEEPQELKLEFLESLKMLSINGYYNNNQTVQNDNDVVRTNVKTDVPEFDWVSDLLAG